MVLSEAKHVEIMQSGEGSHDVTTSTPCSTAFAAATPVPASTASAVTSAAVAAVVATVAGIASAPSAAAVAASPCIPAQRPF